MLRPSFRSALLLTLLAAVGCYSPDCSGLDVDGDFFPDEKACALEVSGDPIASEGEATIYATTFATASPALVARGAQVSVVARVPGEPIRVAVSGEGGLVILEAGEPLACGGDGGGGNGAGGESGSSNGSGGADAAEDTSQMGVRFRADGEGTLVVEHDDATSRWSPSVREAASLTLSVQDPDACTVGGTCFVRGELTDADGVPLYAEEDFTWSTTPETSSGDFRGTLGLEPTESGTLIVTATVLGLTAEMTIEVP